MANARFGLRQFGRNINAWLSRQWKRLPESFRWNLEDTFKPEDISERLLPGEEPLLEIGLAWYRDIYGTIMFNYTTIVAFVTILATLLIVFSPVNILYAFLPSVIFIIALFTAIYEHIVYKQWRLLKTNARLIISVPQPGSGFIPLVDNIEIGGLPKVMDTNWSPNPLWRTFQFFTGARDVSLSLGGYQFETGKVKDPLIIPDMLPEDIFRLRRLIFPVK